MQIYDKSGYTPIHYAAYKNIDRAVDIIIKFALSEDSDRLQSILPNAGSGETDDDAQKEKECFSKSQRKSRVKNWINSISKGDDGFTALHFASFHGNMSMIKMLVKNGADIFA